MPKAILICGRIASGKTTYARRLCREGNAVLLSCDELMLTLYSADLGVRHDEVAGRAQRYLYQKALELLKAGVSVVLDWGFWTAASRRYARNMFESRGFACELHYLNTPMEQILENIDRRNRAVAAGAEQAYPVEAGLLLKMTAAFTEPKKEEVDCCITLPKSVD